MANGAPSAESSQSAEPSRTRTPRLARIAAAAAILVLLALADYSIAGAVQQFARPLTLGQRVQTWIQLAAGALGLLVVLTIWLGRRWRRLVRFSWGLSLAAAAGLSALVWGPPMPLLAAAFATVALAVAGGVVWALRYGID